MQMTMIDLSNSKSNHTQRVVASLASTGWRALIVPAKGKLRSNQQIVEFRARNASVKARLSIFAVGDRGESHRRDERRIQITTTYLSGLERLVGYTDIVLGYDSENDVYIGLDARRLEFGGKKHNASSSVDSTALEHAPVNGILIRPHDTQILGLEYQAIFKPTRLAEYIFNADSIHRNLYVGASWFSDSKGSIHSPGALTVTPENARGELLILETSTAPLVKHKIEKSRVAAYENRNWKALADLSPEELEEIRRKCSELGDKGEYFAFRHEKQRLRNAGQAELSRKVDWISRRVVGRGYDIRSYETDGSPRFIEVKSTSGSGMTFFMSDNEWKVAAREKDAYYIYRIIDVDRTPVLKRSVRNPITAQEARTLERVPAGWKIRLRS